LDVRAPARVLATCSFSNNHFPEPCLIGP